MSRRRPATESIKASEARQRWSQILREVYRGDTRLIVEKDGIPVAGLISAADLERLRMLEEERERNFGVLDEIRSAFADVPDSELEQEIEKAIDALRSERQSTPPR